MSKFAAWIQSTNKNAKDIVILDNILLSDDHTRQEIVGDMLKIDGEVSVVDGQNITITNSRNSILLKLIGHNRDEYNRKMPMMISISKNEIKNPLEAINIIEKLGSEYKFEVNHNLNKELTRLLNQKEEFLRIQYKELSFLKYAAIILSIISGIFSFFYLKGN